MIFLSTRGKSHPVNFSEAMKESLAQDSGLFIPESFPQISLKKTDKLPAIANAVLAPYLQGDRLSNSLSSICDEAFNFPIPLELLDDKTAVLELFHGPTAAFKDVGARFLAGCATALELSQDSKRTVLVATSGDTGAAVASAFHNKNGIDVVILFPKGKVSLEQEKSLTSFGGNVRALAVLGNFDDCQRMVKEAFSDQNFRKEFNPISANSINIARLLPQIVYYVYSSLEYFAKRGAVPNFIVPSGNLGNAVAAFYAKKMGSPIGKIIMATNANNAIPDYFKSGKWKPQPTVATIANAMDVGSPSNMERLLHLYTAINDLRSVSSAISVSDENIVTTIKDGVLKWKRVWCPHTATAVYVRDNFYSQDPGHFIVVATAHPAKFKSVVEPIIGKRIETPACLQNILLNPSNVTEIAPTRLIDYL